ncbi:hypothetical protein CEXT_142661 [Caerostris extrusa]|uniref:Uncharacterized protein n=1 Tax=Caerostris extrusa TaxID=172846 RepID=A0AAV4SVE2_CAEEX|nr:hypothetical protein CEXT_142661 [Caerostris extrusa]
MNHRSLSIALNRGKPSGRGKRCPGDNTDQFTSKTCHLLPGDFSSIENNSLPYQSSILGLVHKITFSREDEAEEWFGKAWINLIFGVVSALFVHYYPSRGCVCQQGRKLLFWFEVEIIGILLHLRHFLLLKSDGVMDVMSFILGLVHKITFSREDEAEEWFGQAWINLIFGVVSALFVHYYPSRGCVCQQGRKLLFWFEVEDYWNSFALEAFSAA